MALSSYNEIKMNKLYFDKQLLEFSYRLVPEFPLACIFAFLDGST